MTLEWLEVLESLAADGVLSAARELESYKKQSVAMKIKKLVISYNRREFFLLDGSWVCFTYLADEPEKDKAEKDFFVMSWEYQVGKNELSYVSGNYVVSGMEILDIYGCAVIPKVVIECLNYLGYELL